MAKLSLIFLFVFIAGAFAATFIVPAKDNSDHPDKCVHKEYVIDLGETTQLKECGELHCHQDKSMDGVTCGSIAAEDNCKLVPGDLSKPYPDCCATVKC